MAFHGFSAEGVGSSATESPAKQQRILRCTQGRDQAVIHPTLSRTDRGNDAGDGQDRPAVRHRASRMVSRVRRDTRYTKDKTLYRANMWLFFRRARRERESVPAYYFELHPEYWAFGCWGAWGRGELEALREMILAEDRLFLDAFRAVNSCRRCTLRARCTSARNSRTQSRNIRTG